MELYVGTVPEVSFYLPTPDTSVSGATYSLSGAAPVSVSQSVVDGVSSAQMPYLQSEGSLVVTWSFTVPGSGSYTQPVNYDVVRPILSLQEVKSILGTTDDAEASKIERAVRLIIQSHCGQSFGYGTKTLTIDGHGESALRLPERLITLTTLSTLTATLNVNRSIVTSDGWYLKKGWSDAVTAIESTDEYFNATEVWNIVGPGEPGYEQPDHGPIIMAPSTSGTPTPWRDDYPFKITGVWGYESVPAQVQEAARLLINDYACGESTYRDRYLKDISAADWSFEFSSQAWESTGNVRADQLLSDYVILDWATI